MPSISTNPKNDRFTLEIVGENGCDVINIPERKILISDLKKIDVLSLERFSSYPIESFGNKISAYVEKTVVISFSDAIRDKTSLFNGKNRVTITVAKDILEIFTGINIYENPTSVGFKHVVQYHRIFEAWIKAKCPVNWTKLV